jgi:homoserine kinase type II
MAVFTEVSASKAQELLSQLQLGDLVELQGIQGGIENTNYFLTSSVGAYVLTLFERLTHQQLPFYLHLMKHLAHHGIPVPDPVANADGDILLTLEGKPAAVVNRLMGSSELAPTPQHCQAVGHMLARMHLAGKDYNRHQPNLRGLAWWNETVPVVLPFLNASQSSLIQSELAFQNHVVNSCAYAALPRGPVHADLFRDNVMFEGTGNALQLTGFFDFYFAGTDKWLFDLAVTVNDWCINQASGDLQQNLTSALLKAYQSIRPFQAAEISAWTMMLRAAALRFWISRLWDFYLPRNAQLLTAHDPQHFERILRLRILNHAN